MGSSKNIYGEGNYEATRQYNAATRKFLQSGRVQQAARNAAPRTPAEAAVLREAEKAGLSRRRDVGDVSKRESGGNATVTSAKPKTTGAGRGRSI